MLLLETCSIRLVMPELAHPEYLLRNRMLCSPLYIVNHINMKYANDSTIFKRMFIIMSGQGHDISMVAWINYILTQMYIISGVVDPNDFVAIQTVIDNANLPMFLY